MLHPCTWSHGSHEIKRMEKVYLARAVKLWSVWTSGTDLISKHCPGMAGNQVDRLRADAPLNVPWSFSFPFMADWKTPRWAKTHSDRERDRCWGKHRGRRWLNREKERKQHCDKLDWVQQAVYHNSRWKPSKNRKSQNYSRWKIPSRYRTTIGEFVQVIGYIQILSMYYHQLSACHTTVTVVHSISMQGSTKDTIWMYSAAILPVLWLWCSQMTYRILTCATTISTIYFCNSKNI